MHELSDRALKERIIGAVVLVVVAVLIVPIFLDGPSDDREIVSQSVTLPGQDDSQRKQQTIVLERDRAEPVPVSRAPAPSQASPAARSASPPEAAPAEPAPETLAAPAGSTPREESPAAPAEVSETGMWAVQLGSFSSQENAERLAAGLREQGYAAFLSQLSNGGQQLHRVRVGPQKDRESAETIAEQLEKSGHSGQVVPHP